VSTHYLISHFNSEINDVVSALGVPPQTLITGNYLVRIPDDVPVQSPTNLSDLVTKKYAGLLGTHGLFTQIAYDDMLDGLGVDTANSNGVTIGNNGSVGLYPKHSSYTPVLQTTPYGITWSGPGVGPSQVLVTYELFEYVDTDDSSDPYTRSYREVTPDSDLTLQVSFNNGGGFVSTLDKAVTTIPALLQGTQIVLKFTRTSNVSVRGRVYLGSWSVLF